MQGPFLYKSTILIKSAFPSGVSQSIRYRSRSSNKRTLKACATTNESQGTEAAIWRRPCWCAKTALLVRLLLTKRTRSMSIGYSYVLDFTDPESIRWTTTPSKESVFRAYFMWCWVWDNAPRLHTFLKVWEHSRRQSSRTWAAASKQLILRNELVYSFQ